MTKNEATQKYDADFREALRTTIFPQDQLPDGFDQWKHAAFQFRSVTSFQQTYNLSWAEYKVLMMKKAAYSLFEIAIICNTIEERTPNEMAKYLRDLNYYTMQDAVHTINTQWAKIVDPIRTSVQRKIEIMSAPNGQYKTSPLTFTKGNA